MSGILQGVIASLFSGGGPYTVIQTFTTSGSWTCPTGVTEVGYLIVTGKQIGRAHV